MINCIKCTLYIILSVKNIQRYLISRNKIQKGIKYILYFQRNNECISFTKGLFFLFSVNTYSIRNIFMVIHFLVENVAQIVLLKVEINYSKSTFSKLISTETVSQKTVHFRYL